MKNDIYISILALIAGLLILITGVYMMFHGYPLSILLVILGAGIAYEAAHGLK